MIFLIKKIFRDYYWFIRDIIKFKLINYHNDVSKKEKMLIQILRKEILVECLESPSQTWSKFIRLLRFYVLILDPRNFLQWQIIKKTMFVCGPIPDCIRQLKQSPDWQSLWSKGVIEKNFGNPEKNNEIAYSSTNLIWHAYHLLKFTESTLANIYELGIIFEFGGGYGSMCRLFRQLGFSGKYVIYDLPPFSAIQRFFLNGIGLRTEKKYTSENSVNYLIHQASDLQFMKSVPNCKKLFIATWSLSEAPMKLREEMALLVSDFDYFLIGFQPIFDEIDNYKYFTDFSKQFPMVFWTIQKVGYFDSYYLFGRRIEPECLN